MKKIFTLISVALCAMSVNAQTTESYVAVDAEGNISAEYAAVIDADNVATNVENGSSVVKFGTDNVQVEAVGSAEPADKVDPDDPTVNLGQDITIGALIDEETHTYELVSINSTKPIKWEKKNQGDINFWYMGGNGVPAVSMVAEEVYTDGDATGKYRVLYTTFDPAVGGEPQSGLYYKITTKVDGTLKVGIWANKGNRTTYLVDGETKQPCQYSVEGYINGQNYTEDDVTAGRFTLFEAVNKTYNDIVSICNDTHKEYKVTVCPKSYRFRSADLEYISTHILRNFRYDPKKAPQPDNIRIFEARDMYSEAEYVCASIRRLIHYYNRY